MLKTATWNYASSWIQDVSFDDLKSKTADRIIKYDKD